MSQVSVALDDLEHVLGMIEPNDIYDESRNPGLAFTMLRLVDVAVAAGSTARLGYPSVEIKTLQRYLRRHQEERELDVDREKLGLPTVGDVVPERWR